MAHDGKAGGTGHGCAPNGFNHIPAIFQKIQ
jgi:hypothetical protein